MDLGLEGATAVVVGGSRGMGRAAAQCLADDGARVAVISRSGAEPELDEVFEDLTRRGSPEPFGVSADVSDSGQIEAAFVDVGKRFGGRLNILVNAVGPSTRGGFDTLTDKQWGEAIELGAMSMVRCVRAALPLLRSAEWARIVNFSASSTKRQGESLVAYTAAKSMVASVSKNLALSLARDEILVNVISPGSVASEGLVGWARSVGVDGDDPYQLMAAITEHFGHPAHLPRAGLPEEIGPVVAFLASRRNSYMTGANINVDGGTDFC
ncbi:SDR family oxidoreductase [Mycobacterium sp. ACS4331]|uniref:SDR family NAD(P)-dependent oxidoreductase n=1 Tax=Mycobacterium sp. ACS4331 TaxID=1834121 RepID=UPI0007FC100B|nr:SDR family oxidoreductase [Mycobacterium sp. ACS4331]OBF13434.1 short-chain dehydrogenase [Mycobacterium sp. ACS4331]